MPCWNGPKIGHVGDSYDILKNNMRAILENHATSSKHSQELCPINHSNSDIYTSLHDFMFESEIASQLFWYARAPYI